MLVHSVENTYAVQHVEWCGIVGDFGIEHEGTERYESKPIHIGNKSIQYEWGI
jgi:hypothetical protein